jgi:succinate dehydrogenase / fumarate reductase cytochrome b subunit
MNFGRRFLRSSIGKKQVMAITGLLLCGFLTTHLLGNFLIYLGPETFNTYSHKLLSNPLILPIEIVLMLIFLAHIALAIRLTIENKKARPQPYFVKVKTGRGATFASSTMPYTGMLAFIFLVVHILQFRFGMKALVIYNGVEMKDLYHLVINHFQELFWVVWYVVAQILLGIHLSHGFASALGSLGFHHPLYAPFLKKMSLFFAITMAVGFSSIPLWAYFTGGQ